MRKKFVFLLLLFCLVLSCNKTKNSSNNEFTNGQVANDKFVNKEFVGKFEYFTNYGKTVGGSPILLQAIFIITNKNGRLACLYTEDGFQTMVRIEGNVVVSNNTAKIYFKKWGKENIFPDKGYRTGDLINTMTKTNGQYIVKYFKDEFKTNKYIFEKTE